ncbi:blast:Heme oxygenase 1 [Drosophila guanche]|uniref:Heme oxygenase n=1 Tax=Drosophila guanche TaxID=7266 RepID=A0A3B0K6Y4_DROGU|nr:blast:Heme oxygenase 1 [Drosophila guanche]
MSTVEETSTAGTKAEEDVGDEGYVDMTFTKELRKATKDVHNLTDVLVNAKFAFALSDDEVWYDGLLAFYEIYKFFETRLPERLLPKELHRAEAFERDFAYFYGPNWKDTYEPRPVVKKYLAHLEKGGEEEQQKQAEADAEVATANAASVGLDKEDLEARPMPAQVTICPPGCEATYFPGKINVLKAKLRRVFNSQYGAFDDELQAEFIEESRNVFRLNLEVIRTVKGVNRANLKKLLIAAVLISSIYLAIKFATK